MALYARAVATNNVILRRARPAQNARHALRVVPRSRIVTLLPVIFLIYASFVPQQVRISLADQNFFPWRIVGIVLLPWVFTILAQNRVKFRIWDAFLSLSVFWMVFAFMAYYGPAQGAVRGLALAIDVAIPYFIARTCIRSPDDLRITLVAVAPGLCLAGLSMFAEVLAARPLVRPAFASIFGDLPIYENGVVVSTTGKYGDEMRLGLLRAAGPFAHPILAGMFLASFLPLYVQSGLRRWPFYVGIAASLLGVFSLSSGAYLLFIIGIGLIVTDRVQSWTTFLNWRLIVPSIASFLLLVHLASDNGLVKVVSRFTLDPNTAYFRQLIWKYGTISVEKNPWIGIGFDNYERLRWMVSSVDNQWLLMAIRFGLISPLAMLTAILFVLLYLGRACDTATEVDRRMYVGTAISFFGMSLMGFTVAYFGGFQSWFFILFGAAASLAACSERVKTPVRRMSPRKVQPAF